MARFYRFGSFRLDPATRELWRGDAPVAVPPRAFDCIVYLLEHRERAVGRDELIAAVWGRTETGDGTLGQTVLAARRALDDTGKEQHVIRTVFRFGYHWVAPVDVCEEAAPEATPPLADATTIERADIDATLQAPIGAGVTTTPSAKSRAAWIALAVAIVLAVFAYVTIERWRSPATTTTSSAPGSQGAIALVLPVTVTAESGYDWVRLGLMDLIGARLRAAGLPVVPSDNVVALTGHTSSDPAADARELARATGANLVVDARAENTGGRWRVALRTMLGRNPPISALGESGDVLAAARIAADRLAQQLGYTPAPDAHTSTDAPVPADLSQQIEAAMLSDRLDVARALIASAPAEQRDQPELRLRAAQIEYQAGDFDAAEAGFDAVAKAASAEQDAVLHARALSNLGVIAAMRDNTELARRRFDESIDLLRTQHAPDALGKALNGRANIAGFENRYDDALHDFAEARAAFESTGNLLALAVLDSNLAAMDMHRFHYAEAEPVFRRAAERFATFGVNAAELNAWTGAAEIDLALLEPDTALALEPRLRDLIAKVADPARKRAGELTRVEIVAANGRLQEAATALATVTRAADESGDRAAVTRAHMIAARLAIMRGDTHAAARESEIALKSATAADDARERARTFRLRVAALLADRDTSSADATMRALAEFAEHDGSPPAKLYARLASADAAAASGNAGAGTIYAQALSDADALRIPQDLREVAAAYSSWLVGSGDLARAGATAERVAGWSARDYESALVQLRVQRALGSAALWQGALTRARALAGERAIPADLQQAPAGG